MDYRREIDGLRAIAVLPVILYHAGLSAFSGGYVGVDVFFVISGYLITTIIATERQAGTFSIVRFYERRARRILPALCFVVLCMLPLAWVWMLPYRLEEFGRGLISVGLFCSNILFWIHSGYFDTAGQENPLLHTWSLGVEEQYYVLFPLLILALWSSGRRNLTLTIAVIALTSLMYSQGHRHADPSATFYLLPSRAWELLAGSLVALALHRRATPDGKWNELLAALGLGMIVYAIAKFNEMTPFPGFRALVPVVGTVLVIVFAHRRTWTGRLLSLPPLVWVGLISYSAYLWHQPLFAFARIRSMEDPSQTTMMILAAACLPLAALTWALVERPFRNRARFNRRQIFTVAAVGTALLIVIGGAAHLTDGFGARYGEAWRQVQQLDPEVGGEYVRRRYNDAVRNMPFRGRSDDKLLLIGDSYAQDFYNMILETGAFAGYDIAAVHYANRCQLYLGTEDVSQFIPPDFHDKCRTVYGQQLFEMTQQADVVVVAFSWQQWAAERLPATLRALRLRPDQKLIVLGRKRFTLLTADSVRKMSLAELKTLRATVKTTHLVTVATMIGLVPPDILLDIHGLICDGASCPLLTPDGDLISFDASHLTPEGARYVGRLVFATPQLREFSR